MSESTPSERYADAAGAADEHLDEELAEIRRLGDAGSISLLEAADMRIAALERHIAAIRALRAEHFGPDSRT